VPHREESPAGFLVCQTILVLLVESLDVGDVSGEAIASRGGAAQQGGQRVPE
jgi:hypothetical protein